MNYYNLLEEKAKLGFDELLAYLQTDKNLLWTIKIDDEEHITEVEIETWDEENYNSEFLTSFEFNNKTGKLLD